MLKKKVLVAFYSLKGHTRKIGSEIAKLLKADIEEIKDLRDRSRLISWQTSAFEEDLKTATKIQKPEKNPLDYDLVIIGTPIWDGIVPAVKEYLTKNKFKKVAFFATFDAASEDAFYVMEKICKKKPIATLEVQDRQAFSEEAMIKIRNFCKKIK
jgi:flavodoxin